LEATKASSSSGTSSSIKDNNMETNTKSQHNLNSTIITKLLNLSPSSQRRTKLQTPMEHLPIPSQQLQEATHSEVAAAAVLP